MKRLGKMAFSDSLPGLQGKTFVALMRPKKTRPFLGGIFSFEIILL